MKSNKTGETKQVTKSKTKTQKLETTSNLPETTKPAVEPSAINTTKRNKNIKTETKQLNLNNDATTPIATGKTNESTKETSAKSFKFLVIQFLKFLCFSLGAAVIEFSSFSVIILFGSVIAADVISVILSCLFNFTLNRKYTFKSANNIYLGMILYGIFYLIFTPLGAWFINSLVNAGVNEFLAKFIKMLINFVLDFSFCKFVVFRVKGKKQPDVSSIKK